MFVKHRASQAPTDTDGDGIPDSYEIANGLNPNANDAMSIASNGYASKSDVFSPCTRFNSRYAFRH